MNFAESLLAGRIQKRKQDAQMKRSEVKHLSQIRFDLENERRNLDDERIILAGRQATAIKAKAAMDAALAQFGFDSISDEPKRMPQNSEVVVKVHNDLTISWWSLLGRPWTCLWRIFLILSAIGCVALGLIVRHDPSLHLLYSAAMSACIPVSICIFFAELARRVDVKWFSLLVVYIVGGIASIVTTLFVNSCFPVFTTNPVWAGVVEEPCKCAVLIVLMVAFPKTGSTFAGLAFGAAVGAGFASIETFDYAYRFSADGMPSTFILVLRGVLSPLMHTGWTAALGGALWYIRYPKRRELRTQRIWCAIGVFAAMICCHCLWNAPLSVGQIPLIVWVLIFFYAKMGAQELPYLGREVPQ